MQWSGLAMSSREHGGAPVAMTMKWKATLPQFKRWRWWLEEVGVMVE